MIENIETMGRYATRDGTEAFVTGCFSAGALGKYFTGCVRIGANSILFCQWNWQGLHMEQHLNKDSRDINLDLICIWNTPEKVSIGDAPTSSNGEKTMDYFKTGEKIVWNGSMGIFEVMHRFEDTYWLKDLRMKAVNGIIRTHADLLKYNAERYLSDDEIAHKLGTDLYPYSLGGMQYRETWMSAFKKGFEKGIAHERAKS